MKVTFLLGVESLDAATAALKTLPFVAVDGSNVTTPQRMNLTVQHNVLGEGKGALIILGGEFTPEEGTAVERLGAYEFDGMQDFVVKVLAKLATMAVEEGAGGTVRLLTRADASGGGALSGLRVDTSRQQAAPAADSPAPFERGSFPGKWQTYIAGLAGAGGTALPPPTISFWCAGLPVAERILKAYPAGSDRLSRPPLLVELENGFVARFDAKTSAELPLLARSIRRGSWGLGQGLDPLGSALQELATWLRRGCPDTGKRPDVLGGVVTAPPAGQRMMVEILGNLGLPAGTHVDFAKDRALFF